MEVKTEIKNFIIENNKIRVEKWLTNQTIDNRFVQPSYQRLVEYITGFNQDTPSETIIDKIEKDQKIIREKYGLPSLEYVKENLSEHERYLRKLAEENKVQIREKSDCGKYFGEDINCSANFFEKEGRIGTTINKTSYEEYMKSIDSLEHEIIHSCQIIKFPKMTIEQMEYEAYVAGVDTNSLYEGFSNQNVSRFFRKIESSVKAWYEEKSEGKPVEIKPVWDNPEYFLKNVDGISDEQIKEYKDKHQIVDTQK